MTTELKIYARIGNIMNQLDEMYANDKKLPSGTLSVVSRLIGEIELAMHGDRRGQR